MTVKTISVCRARLVAIATMLEVHDLCGAKLLANQSIEELLLGLASFSYDYNEEIKQSALLFLMTSRQDNPTTNDKLASQIRKFLLESVGSLD